MIHSPQDTVMVSSNLDILAGVSSCALSTLVNIDFCIYKIMRTRNGT